MVWQRARSDEQKEQRRQVLLDAAERLHASRPIEEVSLNAIAREANISKANVYRYFESREEVFLQLTLDSVERWSEILVRRLDGLEAPATAEAVAESIAQTTLEHPRLGRLSSVLSTVLERNVSTEAVVRFKTAYLEFLGPMHRALARALGDVSDEDVHTVLQAAYFLLVAMWPIVDPPDAVREALERPELASMCVHFETDFPKLLAAAIHGVRGKG